jgi:hypothetical protein
MEEVMFLKELSSTKTTATKNKQTNAEIPILISIIYITPSTSFMFFERTS